MQAPNQSGQAIAMMLAAFPSSSINPDMAAAAYVLACDGIPARRVIEASRDFIAGRARRENQTFAPSAAEFAVYARGLPLDQNETAAMRAKLDAEQVERKAIAGPSIGPTQQLTPGTRSRVNNLMASFKAENEKASEKGKFKSSVVDPFEASNARYARESTLGWAGEAHVPLTADDPRFADIPDASEPYRWQKAKPDTRAA